MTTHVFPLDRNAVMSFIPHRDPMLFIDSVVTADATSCHARTYTKPTWPVFTGHFPNKPIVPGVLLIESVAQAGALIVCLQGGLKPENVIAFSGVESARFRRPVLPDQHLDIYAEITRQRGGYYKFQGHIDVAGERAIDVQFAAMQMPL